MIAFMHQCGTLNVPDERHCAGCDQPLMPPVPPQLWDVTADFEKVTGLTRIGIRLAGLTAVAYMAGWDAAMDAMHPADQVTP